jgi:hypothetical protein
MGAGCTDFAPLGGNLAANTTTFTDSTVSIGQTYAYRVSAFNVVGQGTAGPVSVTVGIPVIAPGTVVAALVPGTRRVQITWPDLNNEASYTIQRLVGTTVQATNTLAANTTTFQTGNLTPGVTYTFRLTATNALGTSAPVSSNAVTIP